MKKYTWLHLKETHRLLNTFDRKKTKEIRAEFKDIDHAKDNTIIFISKILRERLLELDSITINPDPPLHAA